MRELLMQLAREKRQVTINFPASAAGKLVSASGTITQVGDDCLIMADIYGNSMIVPISGISYVEVKK